MRATAPILAAICLMGCSGERRLIVDVRTDLVPGVELARVETIIEHGGGVTMDTLEVEASADWARGQRVAERAGVETGDALVRVRMLGGTGEELLERRVLVTSDNDRVVTVVATRDCRGVSCTDAVAESCLGMRCVDVRCSPETREFCPTDPDCAADADCSGGSACAPGACVAGACVFAGDDALCGQGEFCDPEAGCGPDPRLALPGEVPSLPTGWTSQVHASLDDAYGYIDEQYLDDGLYWFNNRPHHLALLDAPFEPGLALVATWEIYEVRPPDVVIAHDYMPAVPDMGGPDAFFDAVWCDDFMGTAPGLCVAVGSQNGGDGVYRIEADWSVAAISNFNNVGDIAYDRAGAFDSIGAPTLYWAGPDGLRRFGESVFYAGMLNGAFTEILPDGRLLTMHTVSGTEMRRLVIVEPGTYSETVVLSRMDSPERVARQSAGVYAAVAGDVARLPGYAYALVGTRELIEIDALGTPMTVATAGEGWRWTHAIVPPATHPLGAEGPALYVLEYNPSTEVNRIIRLGVN